MVDTPPSASALDFLDGPNRLEALAHNPLLRVALGLPRGPFAFLDAGAALELLCSCPPLLQRTSCDGQLGFDHLA